MQAIMLAAGEGSRCYPLTYLYPKVVQQVAGIPLLEYMLSWFSEVSEIKKLYLVMNQNSDIDAIERYIEHRPSYIEKIAALFTDLGYRVKYENPDMAIEIIRAKMWGTGGDLRLALDTINSKDTMGEDFIVCNSDYVTIRKSNDGILSPQLGLADIVQYHRASKQALENVMTVALVPVNQKDAGRFGVASTQALNGSQFVTGFREKPDINDIGRNPLVNAGVYVIDRDFIFSHLDTYLPGKKGTNLEKTLLSSLASEMGSRLAAYVLNLYRWFDVGTTEQLVEANICIAHDGKLSGK